MTRAKEFNILVDDIAITHLSFGTEVTHALFPSVSFSSLSVSFLIIFALDTGQLYCRALVLT
jgi:hypothetical protein